MHLITNRQINCFICHDALSLVISFESYFSTQLAGFPCQTGTWHRDGKNAGKQPKYRRRRNKEVGTKDP